jgi:hypothetical protein
MALTDEEKARAKYHLGYLGAAPAASITFGMARPIQTLFLVETALSNLLPAFDDKVRQILGVMDGVECRLVEAQDRLAAKRIDNLELRDDEPTQLEAEYRRWGYRLADLLGCPVYAYSTKYRTAGKTTAGNVSVVG